MTPYSSWIAEKITIASALGTGDCGGGYAEAAIILCATISAMSYVTWDRDGRQDRKKFVETIIRFGPQQLDATKISVPLVAQDLSDSGQRLNVTNKAIYLRGTEVDKTESELMGIYPQLHHLKIRNYSYANLLYEQIRCGFAHSYSAGEKASDSDQIRAIAGVNDTELSYTNEIGPNDLARRRIHFPLRWISEMARSVAQGLDGEWIGRGIPIFQTLKLPKPDRWWIDAECSVPIAADAERPPIT